MCNPLAKNVGPSWRPRQESNTAERLRYVDNVQFIGPCQIIGFKPFKMFRRYWQKICNLNYCFGESQRMYLCKNQVNPCKNITHLMFAISTWDFYNVCPNLFYTSTKRLNRNSAELLAISLRLFFPPPLKYCGRNHSRKSASKRLLLKA